MHELANLAAGIKPKPQMVKVLTFSVNYMKIHHIRQDIRAHDYKASVIARKLFDVQICRNMNRQTQTFIFRAGKERREPELHLLSARGVTLECPMKDLWNSCFWTDWITILNECV